MAPSLTPRDPRIPPSNDRDWVAQYDPTEEDQATFKEIYSSMPQVKEANLILKTNYEFFGIVSRHSKSDSSKATEPYEITGRLNRNPELDCHAVKLQGLVHDPEQDFAILTREPRYSAAKTVLGLPGGLVDPQHTSLPEVAAAEWAEETGNGTDFQLYQRRGQLPTFTQPSHSNEKRFQYYVDAYSDKPLHDVSDLGKQSLDPDETVTRVMVPVQELKSLINKTREEGLGVAAEVDDFADKVSLMSYHSTNGRVSWKSSKDALDLESVSLGTASQ